jgi:hypothetical protein
MTTLKIKIDDISYDIYDFDKTNILPKTNIPLLFFVSHGDNKLVRISDVNKEYYTKYDILSCPILGYMKKENIYDIKDGQLITKKRLLDDKKINTKGEFKIKPNTIQEAHVGVINEKLPCEGILNSVLFDKYYIIKCLVDNGIEDMTKDIYIYSLNNEAIERIEDGFLLNMTVEDAIENIYYDLMVNKKTTVSSLSNLLVNINNNIYHATYNKDSKTDGIAIKTEQITNIKHKDIKVKGLIRKEGKIEEIKPEGMVFGGPIYPQKPFFAFKDMAMRMSKHHDYEDIQVNGHIYWKYNDIKMGIECKNDKILLMVQNENDKKAVSFPIVYFKNLLMELYVQSQNDDFNPITLIESLKMHKKDIKLKM